MMHFTKNNAHPWNLHMDCMQEQGAVQKSNFLPIYRILNITMSYLRRILTRIWDNNMHGNAPI